MKDVIEQTLIDRDILDFLKAVYFGSYKDPLSAACSRAYRDMNRTIRFNGLENTKRIELRNKVKLIFKEDISKLSVENIKCQEDFDLWHRNISERIILEYKKQEIILTYGHAQKWVNMTIKYLYIIGANDFFAVFDFLHIPLDNYVFDIAKASLGIERPEIAWSKWDNYDEQYLYYQKQIREHITGISPLRWEFRNWPIAARSIKS